MKPYLLATASTVALAGAAGAADLPVAYPTKAPPPVPVLNWTGPYIGVNGGAVWLKSTYHGVSAVNTTGSASLKTTGATFGGQAGYNWQTQNFVFGIEGDVNWVNASGSTAVTPGFAGDFFHSKLTWLGTIRGRAGLLVSPNTLVYATGGYAAGRIKHNTPDQSGFADDKTRSGWTAGGGIEYMFASHWTVKAEALYVDFGKSTVQGFLGSGYSADFKDNAVIARIGANFKF